MAKNSVIISVSISKEEAEFIDEKNLSASELIQSKIQEQMRLYGEFNSVNANLQARIEAYQGELQKINAYLDHLDKFNDFQAWKRSWEENKQN